MSNIRKKTNHITPQLTLMWDKSDEPWGARDRESRFIYANPAFYQLLNLPEYFDIIGLSMGELPLPIAEYAEEFHRQDQKTIQTMQRVTSLETHQFGEHNIKQTYICDKFPLYDENNDCIGIFFHMYKTQDFSVSYYYEKTPPATLAFTPPNDTLTQFEWEVLFLTLCSLDEEKISEELMISSEDVINHIQSIYQKFNLPLHAELKDFCKENKLDLYIPARFVTIGSRELN
ncbi:PAS domain-containing protein [Photorhabdus laumondii subsp. laumondii]|uniref:Photorhabdus luminescens subsp. laumondii TTO1 complete genome segment 13/17 n=2 Tax=Photorhabdus laumondii subsp. laumondii TaxID=141679 RepID=Q7N105_PHOLL|nr:MULTISPECIES: PAS domain-containing protein [Photorhabdus]AXG48647.1 LuxR family transcriptional regulator [Photorhabdus laumondii subsp. laumondii]KTL62315.1 LuxR family transcriptional regulator [Photorhabdus laumondii subsp. laumondii]MCC8385366.1 PAS domain-containing protein [Photorhabdus laumondii]MCC8415112.1 PAS domain-containing protein [Photorhabdus laumondii]NDK93925.1 PAS domain-containing protein [Photorhabdus laumondii subsp. laumondii]